jgi:hypothetical protein
MVPILVSGMISGVGIWSLRKSFQFYLVLPTKRMLLLQTTWSLLELPISGT